MANKAIKSKEKPVSGREYTARIGVAMRPGLRKRIELEAKRRGSTKSEVAREAIEAAL